MAGARGIAGDLGSNEASDSPAAAEPDGSTASRPISGCGAGAVTGAGSGGCSGVCFRLPGILSEFGGRLLLGAPWRRLFGGIEPERRLLAGPFAGGGTVASTRMMA